MEYQKLGRSGPTVSRLGFGCCPMGEHAWGRTDESELTGAVHSALDAGVTLFDSADIYGLGNSETLLGKALGSRRTEVLIATKFGVRRTETGKSYYDNSRDWIVTALEQSLRRLKSDYVDIYQVHYWDGTTPLDEIFETLGRVRDSGKIRFFGVTNVDLIEHGLEDPPQGLASFSYEYSLAQRAHEERIRVHSSALDLGFLSWGSLGQGILCGRYDQSTVFGENDRRASKRYPNFHGAKLRKNLEIVALMKEILLGYPDRTLAQLALRWILDHFDSSVILAGIKRPEQLLDNAGAFGWRLAPEEVAALEAASR